MEGTATDILSWIGKVYYNFTCNLPSSVFCFLLRVNLLFLFAVISARFGHSRLGVRSPLFQAVLMGLGTLIAISIPLDRFAEPSALWPWLIFFFLVGCLSLPVSVAKKAHSWQGRQKKIRKIIWIILAILFVLNLIFFGGQQ